VFETNIILNDFNIRACGDGLFIRSDGYQYSIDYDIQKTIKGIER